MLVDVLHIVRWVNGPLSLAAAVIVGYRLGPAMVQWWRSMMMLRSLHDEARSVAAQGIRQEGQARLLFGGYVVLVALGTAQSISLHAPVGPTTPLVFVLSTATVIVMARWNPVLPGVRTERNHTSD